MEDNNQVNAQAEVQPTIQTAQEQVEDPRLIHSEVIGELRKEKIGKPIMVIELFLLFGIVFASLPFINSMLTDENSSLYRFLHPGSVSDTPAVTVNNPEEDPYMDGTNYQPLLADSKIKYKNLIITNISVNNNTITCNLNSYSGIINLDEGEYYIIVSSNSSTELAAFKLLGKVDNVEKQYTFTTYGFNFNNSLAYQGKVVEMKANDYPPVTLNDVDTQGFGSLVCVKGNRVLKYSFQNDFLIGIVDQETVAIKDYDSDEYINLLKLSRTKSENLGASISTVEENESGYVFNATIKYENDYTIPSTVVDNNYYPENTKDSKIAYSQKGKGFDCK